MRKRKFSKKLFAANVAISFLFVSVFIIITYFGFGRFIERYTNLINVASIKKVKSQRELLFNEKESRLEVIPAYGDKYGTIRIDSINVNLPLYYGDNMEILSYGIGHYAGSYFPGEGGTIILAGHNDAGYLEKLSELKKGQIIVIETKYGTFKYEMDSNRIINENDLSAFPIQNEKEMLIIYTCYPNGIGHKTQRYVVYAYRGDNNE